MFDAMQRLHPRGPDSRGIVVDAEGAMLGPDCVLVHRTPQGFHSLAPDEAAAMQAVLFGNDDDPDRLFRQCRSIAEQLERGNIALAQIYGLRLAIGDLDPDLLHRLQTAAPLIKANFNPDQPRIPAGAPGGGEWTDGDGGGPAALSGPSRDPQGNEAPAGAGDDTGPAIEYTIPEQAPDTAKARNSIVRRAAEWLGWAAGVAAAVVPDSRVRAFLRVIEGTAWIVEHLPEIYSYLDPPKTLEELQDAVDEPGDGYEIHHVVESQYRSKRDDSNAKLFSRNRLEARDNLVRIPKWKHVEISSWYSSKNERYGGLTPRMYLRGKSWEEQYLFGLDVMRDFKVLK